MKFWFHFAVLLLLAAVTLFAQDDKVSVTGVVRDSEGEPLWGVVVTATAQGAEPVNSLTDRGGRFELLLAPGQWSIEVTRLNGDLLASSEFRVREGESLTVELVEGTTGDETAPAEEPDEKRDFSAENLDEGGMRAAVELSILTNSVLNHARQRIVNQLASNRFNASFWLDTPAGGGTEISGGAGVRSDAAEPLKEAYGQWRGEGFRLGVDWSEHYLGASGFGQKSWVGSVLAESSMMVGVPVKVNISLRYDHFDYLRTKNYLSPSASLQYTPRDGTTLSAGASYEAMAPSGELGTVFLGDGDDFTAERRLSYELGLKQKIDADTEVSFRAFYKEVSNHIVNLYRPMKDAFAREVLNAGDGIVRGVELGVEKTFLDGLRATVYYTFSEADGLEIRSVDLHFEDYEDFERFLERGLRHDLSTTFEAAFSSTGTRVRAVYRMYLADIEEDSTFSEGISQLLSDHSRLDLNLSQRIDFGLFDNARISFNLAVNNLFNTRRDSIFLSNETELANRPRTIIGGIRIEF